MFKMKRFLHLMLAVMMLLSCIQVPSAYAADTPTTVTVNVTNTPVRGDIVLEKSGMQLVRFADEKDGLCRLASGFAKEEFTAVDEDVQDAVGELLNCISGVFATAQSNKGITLELMPPEMGADASVSGTDILVMPFGIGDTTVKFVVTNKNGWR